MEFLLFHLRFGLACALTVLAYMTYLQKQASYKSNRLFFLVFLLLGLILPLVPLHSWQPVMLSRPVVRISPSFDGLKWLNLFYSAGVCCFAGRLFLQLFYLHRVIRHSQRTEFDGFVVYHTPLATTGPFTFFRRVYLDIRAYPEQDLKVILAHEAAHARQGHSFDLLFMELLLVFFWYNPFCWLAKKYVAQNLEFLADQTAAVQMDKTAYQYALLRTTIPLSRSGLIAGFHSVHLKKRITMLNQTNTAKNKRVKYVTLSAALLAALLLNSSLFSQRVSSKMRIRQIIATEIRHQIQASLSHIPNGQAHLKAFNNQKKIHENRH